VGVGSVTGCQSNSRKRSQCTYDPPKPCSDETRLSGVPSCFSPSCYMSALDNGEERMKREYEKRKKDSPQKACR
jgi:hypothetical protein